MANEVKSVRFVRRGDIVRTKNGENEEVVREVSIVLGLSNGANEIYQSTESVEIIPPEVIEEEGNNGSD